MMLEAQLADISGNVFEDINYGGGVGRPFFSANSSALSSGWATGAIGIENARVELYNTTSGAFIKDTFTNVNGDYTFLSLGLGTYSIRVVSETLSSNRGSNATGNTIIPTQTYRQDQSISYTNEVGGTNTTKKDTTSNTTSANLNTLTSSISEPKSTTIVNLFGVDVIDIDFGFNYDVIVNTNDSGQGSLRQFILNSNELDNVNLNQTDFPTGGVAFSKPAGIETSIFMIPGTAPFRIEPTAVLNQIADEETHLSGYTQNGAAEGTIGSRSIAIELYNSSSSFNGLLINADSVQISGLSVLGFNIEIYAFKADAKDLHIWGNSIGVFADGTIPGTFGGTGVYLYQHISGAIGCNADMVNDANEGNIVSNSYDGLYIRNSTGILIAGNYVGLDATGLLDFGNRYNGIYLRDATGVNHVGFKDDALSVNPVHFRNIISGNGNDAIRISDSDGQVIAGNFIGPNRTLTAGIPNMNYGIQIQGAVSNTIIGTNSNGNDDVLERNIISGNSTGMRTLGGGTGTGNIIAGNYIGTDSTGNVALPNGYGISINGNYSQTIIGTNGDNLNDAVEGNVISGNTDDGIRLDGTNNNTIAGNKIGLGADGITGVGNGRRGILVAGTASDNVFGYSTSMSNYDANIVGNIIANNLSDTGLGISGTGTGNRISRNKFYNNGSLAIDLDYDGVTANDLADADIGANELLNFPVIDTAYIVGNIMTIRGIAPSGVSIEFYLADSGPNPNPLPSGYTASMGEGQQYLFTEQEGSVNDLDPTIGLYTDDGTGSTVLKADPFFEFNVDVSGMGLDYTSYITAISITGSGHTSEFGRNEQAVVTELCANSSDDDGDGLIDCADPDCSCCEAQAPVLSKN